MDAALCRMISNKINQNPKDEVWPIYEAKDCGLSVCTSLVHQTREGGRGKQTETLLNYLFLFQPSWIKCVLLIMLEVVRANFDHMWHVDSKYSNLFYKIWKTGCIKIKKKSCWTTICNAIKQHRMSKILKIYIWWFWIRITNPPGERRIKSKGGFCWITQLSLLLLYNVTSVDLSVLGSFWPKYLNYANTGNYGVHPIDLTVILTSYNNFSWVPIQS